MRQSTAEAVQKQTIKNYQTLDAEYACTRQHSWPVGRVAAQYVTQYVHDGVRVADIGCGGGDLVKILADTKLSIEYDGVDVSSHLLQFAIRRFGDKCGQVQLHWHEASMHRLPLKSNAYDLVFVLASFHHIPSVQQRAVVMQELARIVAPGGYVIMVNWNLWTRVAFKKYGLYTQCIKNVFKGYDIGDFFIPWHSKQQHQPLLRYYHSFTKSQLAQVISNSTLELDALYTTSLTTHPKSPAQVWVSVAHKPVVPN